jgi:hypothetical protein
MKANYELAGGTLLYNNLISARKQVDIS